MDTNSSNNKKGSSLARAAKGTRMGNRTTKTSSTISKAHPSYYVVGAGGGESSATNTNTINRQDEKKSADALHHGTMMMVEDHTSSTSALQQKATARTSITSTYFQIPDNNNNHQRQHHPINSSSSNEHHHDNHNSSSGMDLDPAPATTTTYVVHPASRSQASSYTIGGESHQSLQQAQHHQQQHFNDEVEKMEGVIDLSEKQPMVVLDGANIAYAYDKAWHQGGSSQQKRPQPDARGIVVACHYFLSAGIRVLAVVPSTMMHRDPHQKILSPLEQKGVVVPAPSRDDDDAYAITIARREDAKAQQRGDGPGYVMSNDHFRDAQQREETEEPSSNLGEWLTEGSFSEKGKTGPGRISFTFCDTGSMDDHGDKVLDIVPNPRHPLVQFIEKHHGAANRL